MTFTDHHGKCECYWNREEKTTYSDALELCSSDGGTLAMDTNRYTHDFMIAALSIDTSLQYNDHLVMH